MEDSGARDTFLIKVYKYLQETAVAQYSGLPLDDRYDLATAAYLKVCQSNVSEKGYWKSYCTLTLRGLYIDNLRRLKLVKYVSTEDSGDIKWEKDGCDEIVEVIDAAIYNFFLNQKARKKIPIEIIRERIYHKTNFKKLAVKCGLSDFLLRVALTAFEEKLYKEIQPLC